MVQLDELHKLEKHIDNERAIHRKQQRNKTNLSSKYHKYILSNLLLLY